MIVIGRVSTSDADKGSVRVVYPDRDDLVSGELPIIVPGGWGRGNAVPQPEETVLCVFLDNSRSTGYCLGTYYGSEDEIPGTSNQRGIWFEDGSYVFYDRVTKTLNLKAAGSVQIDGNLNVTGTITSGG